MANTTTTMPQNIFQSLGLSPNEVKIYLALVEHGESSVSDISVAAKVHRRNAYDAINRLIEKGLCFEIVSPTENRYNAVNPDKLNELFGERERELRSLLPVLKKKFKHRYAPEEAYIYRGLEGQKNIWQEVLKTGKDSYFIGAKGGWFDPRLEKSRQLFFKEAKKRKIKFIQLFDFEVRGKVPKFAPAELKYKFLPKEYSTNSAIHIFGDHVVTYTGLGINKLKEDLVFFVIISRELAESYRTWFWYMWKKC